MIFAQSPGRGPAPAGTAVGGEGVVHRRMHRYLRDFQRFAGQGVFAGGGDRVDAACCAGVTPESYRTALRAMKACQIAVEHEGETD